MALALAVVGLACAAPPSPSERADLVAAAIAARGGPIEGFTRRSRLLVHYGFPGRWSWEIAFHRPDRFRLALQTTGEEQSFESDGKTLRTYLGSALVAEEPAGGACTRSLARWLAVVTLDELEGPDFRWQPAPLDDAPPGATHSIEAVCRGDASHYRLWFDAELRLVAASGPISIPTLGEGRLMARFSDYRRVDGLRVPFRVTYRLDGQPFVEETILAFEPAAPALAGSGSGTRCRERELATQRRARGERLPSRPCASSV